MGHTGEGKQDTTWRMITEDEEEEEEDDEDAGGRHHTEEEEVSDVVMFRSFSLILSSC